MSEPPVDNLLTVAQAIAIIDTIPVSPRVVDGVPVHHVLAEDVLADRDYPPFDKSLMDGYAVRAVDAADGAELRVVGEIAAGGAGDVRVNAGEAVAIMTGAPMPPGADGVVPVENIAVVGDRIRVRGSAAPGRYIAKRGSDCIAGATVLRAGTHVSAAQQAVLASLGVAKAKVFATPQVAVLTTGDEVVAGTPGPHQIRDSNGPMLATLLSTLGCDVANTSHVEDEPKAVRHAIASRLLDRDALFITGGMSMGKYDYVPQTLIDLGFTLHVTKLRIKPGKPFVFASKDGKFVFGLPGNPVSAFVCTLRLASRLITRLRGGAVAEKWLDAELESPLPANGPREFYQPAMLVRTGNRPLVARPLEWKGSADIFTLARADALLVRPENDPPRPAGSRVQLLEVPR